MHKVNYWHQYKTDGPKLYISRKEKLNYFSKTSLLLCSMDGMWPKLVLTTHEQEWRNPVSGPGEITIVASKGDIKLVFSKYSHSTSPSKWILVIQSLPATATLNMVSLIILILRFQVWIFPVALSICHQIFPVFLCDVSHCCSSPSMLWWSCCPMSSSLALRNSLLLLLLLQQLFMYNSRKQRLVKRRFFYEKGKK